MKENQKEGLAVLVKCASQSLASMLQLDPGQIDVDMPVADDGC